MVDASWPLRLAERLACSLLRGMPRRPDQGFDLYVPRLVGLLRGFKSYVPLLVNLLLVSYRAPPLVR